jgi:hypothetical protein
MSLRANYQNKNITSDSSNKVGDNEETKGKHVNIGLTAITVIRSMCYTPE